MPRSAKPRIERRRPDVKRIIVTARGYAASRWERAKMAFRGALGAATAAAEQYELKERAEQLAEDAFEGVRGRAVLPKHEAMNAQLDNERKMAELEHERLTRQARAREQEATADKAEAEADAALEAAKQARLETAAKTIEVLKDIREFQEETGQRIHLGDDGSLPILAPQAIEAAVDGGDVERQSGA